MDTQNEIYSHFGHTDDALDKTIFLRRIYEDLRKLKNGNNFDILEKHIEVLVQYDDLDSFDDTNVIEILNECIEWTTKCIFTFPSISADKKIIFQKFLFLFLMKKLSITKDENFESNELRLSLINNGCAVVKHCMENNLLSQSEYYICKSLFQLDKLENFQVENFSVRCVLSHKRTLLSLYNIEKLIKENLFEEALQELIKQKANIIELKIFQEYFICICYNFSLSSKQVKKFEMALNSLLLAYDVCKRAAYPLKSMKTVLHFLVYICFEYNQDENWKNALNALDLRNGNSLDMVYIIGKLKVAFISQNSGYLEVLNGVVEWENLKVENVREIVHYLVKNNFSTRAAEFVRKVRCKPFSNNDKFVLLKIEIEVCIIQNDQRVLSLRENIIALAKQKDVCVPSVQSLCELLLSHAGTKFRGKMIEDSLIWYNFCAELCEAGGLNIQLTQQVHMRICLCYIETSKWNLAKQTFSSLKWTFSTADPLQIYLALQIAFFFNDEKLVEKTLNMNDCGDDKITKILLSCCHKAFLSGKKEFLFRILEAILLKFRGCEGIIVSVKVSQCLIGLCLNFPGDESAYDKYLLYMDKAINALQNNLEDSETPELSQWFSRAAWNLALTPDIESKYMLEFFLRCCCFCEISKNFTRLKNSLMLAAAAGLHVIRQMKEKNDDSERKAILSKIMTVIEKCKSLESGSNMALLRLLYLYEFEAKCHTGKWKDGTENMKEILQLPFMDVKTLEHIAAIANEFTPCNYKIIMEALKIAAQKVSEKQHHNSSEASKTYHSLMQVMFYAQEYISPSTEEDSLQLCSKLLKLIESNMFRSYPQLEVLWLMIKCWNWGIHKLTHNDSKRAYKWCTLAMAFLNKLDSLKALHEKRLHEMYATYFSGFRNETDHLDY